MEGFSFLFSPVSWIVTSATGVYIFYRYLTSNFSYFSDQGIPGPKPIPIFGTMWGLWNMNMLDYDMEVVKKHGKILGQFDGCIPNLWVTDAELIKSIFIKDFDHFVDRRALAFKSKFIRKWLILLKGQEWKDVRSSTSLAFSPRKIKRMSVLIKECVDELTLKFDALAKNEGKLDAKILFSGFTMDVIARCAFGIKIDDVGDKDDPFVRNAKVLTNPPNIKSPLALLPVVYPRLFFLIGNRMIVTKEFKFFFNMLENVLLDRAQSKEEYGDFIAVATESMSSMTKEENGRSVPMWTPEEIHETIVGQSTLFMQGGFDTTATTLTNCCFMLARNQDVQNKLHECIVNKLVDYNDVSHEMVQDLSYVDQFINEVLRLYPPAVRVERLCTKDITYDKIHIKKGTIVTVPSFPLHYSEEYYSEPKKFDPDRWSTENKPNRNPYAFMPFGMGPRNCVGMQFALEEIKLALCSLVKRYRFFPVEETPEKLKFDVGLTIRALQPIHAIVGIELR